MMIDDLGVDDDDRLGWALRLDLAFLFFFSLFALRVGGAWRGFDMDGGMFIAHH
jgi:hypothetical protein